MERCYGRHVAWLLPGLQHLCRLGRGKLDNLTPDRTLLDPTLAVQDVPVALLHAVRSGLVVSPAGVSTSCYVTASDLLEGVVPLLAWLYCLNDRRLEAGRDDLARCLILLAAVPGAGKSVVVNLLAQFSGFLKGYPAIQVIGMDGWHFPNRILKVRTAKDEFGQIVPLASRKGSPNSFDVKGLVSDMESLVRDPASVGLPVYDRTLHDPVPDSVQVNAPIVLLEGNYLLLQGQGWEGLVDFASGSIWMDVPLELAQASVLQRHMAVGRTRQEAESKWAGNDWPNALTAMRGRPLADAVLYMDGARRIRFVHRPQVTGVGHHN